MEATSAVLISSSVFPSVSICFDFCDVISNDFKRHNVFLRSVIQ